VVSSVKSTKCYSSFTHTASVRAHYQSQHATSNSDQINLQPVCKAVN